MSESQKTILLVEDNPDDEALALLALRKNGIQSRVVVVRDGVEALDYLFARGSYSSRDKYDLPQVVLLDLKLPKLDGFGVLKEIRASSTASCLPVVILTSSKEDRDLVESYSRGVNSYIQKPVDFSEFTEAVRQLGQYWLVLNEVAPVRRVDEAG